METKTIRVQMDVEINADLLDDIEQSIEAQKQGHHHHDADGRAECDERLARARAGDPDPADLADWIAIRAGFQSVAPQPDVGAAVSDYDSEAQR